MPIEAPGSERIRYLDGWRGVSLLCVLVGHFFGTPGLHIAELGVEFFFVLSGRLMAEILFIEKSALPRFYGRRFSRIYPALASFVLLAFLATIHTQLHFNPTFIATALTFTYNYVRVLGHIALALDHVWSLCVEEHAYMLLGVIAFFSRRYGWRVLPLVCVLAAASMADGAISSAVLEQDWFTAYWRTDTHVASVLMSAAIYLATRQSDRLGVTRVPGWFPVTCIALGAAAFLDVIPWAASYTVGTTLLALGVCTLDVAADWLLGALSGRVLTWFGLLSYSIYLWQQPFYWTGKINNSPAWQRSLLLAGALVCGVASYHLLERPARRFLNRAFERWRSPAQAG